MPCHSLLWKFLLENEMFWVLNSLYLMKDKMEHGHGRFEVGG